MVGGSHRISVSDAAAALLSQLYRAVALIVAAAFSTGGLAPVARLRFARQPEAGQRHPGKAEAEFLECRTARDRLGQALG